MVQTNPKNVGCVKGRRKMKIVNFIFFLIGLLFFSELTHELIHYYSCTGVASFSVGINTNLRSIGGLTWCSGTTSGELLPTVVQLGIIIGFLIWRYEKIR